MFAEDFDFEQAVRKLTLSQRELLDIADAAVDPDSRPSTIAQLIRDVVGDLDELGADLLDVDGGVDT